MVDRDGLEGVRRQVREQQAVSLFREERFGGAGTVLVVFSRSAKDDVVACMTGNIIIAVAARELICIVDSVGLGLALTA